MKRLSSDFFVISNLLVLLTSLFVLLTAIQPAINVEKAPWIVGILSLAALAWRKNNQRFSVLYLIALGTMAISLYFIGVSSLLVFFVAEVLFFVAHPLYSSDDEEEDSFEPSLTKAIPLLSLILLYFYFYTNQEYVEAGNLVYAYVVFRAMLWTTSEDARAESLLFTLVSCVTAVFISKMQFGAPLVYVWAGAALVSAFCRPSYVTVCLAGLCLYATSPIFAGLLGTIAVLCARSGWPTHLAQLFIGAAMIPAYLQSPTFETLALLTVTGAALGFSWLVSPSAHKPNRKDVISMVSGGLILSGWIYLTIPALEKLTAIESWEPFLAPALLLIIVAIGLSTKIKIRPRQLSAERGYERIVSFFAQSKKPREFRQPTRGFFDLELPSPVENFLSDYRITTALTLGLFGALLWGITLLL